MLITGKTYDVLKFLALTVLPALATLYFALAGIWGLPSAEQVVGTIVAVDTFLGVLLQISSSNFKSDQVGEFNVIDKADGVKTFSLDLDGHPSELDLENKDEIRFRVNKKKAKRANPGTVYQKPKT